MSSVNIDGNKIRALREKKELTQLYVATVIGVTTDTISRWENKKYPSIKLENAIKLAETLDAELEDILELAEIEGGQVFDAKERKTQAPQDNIHQQKKITNKTFRIWWISFAGVCFSGILLSLYSFLFSSSETAVYAFRTLPKNTAPNVSFPVMIRVQAKEQPQAPVLLREKITGNATASISGVNKTQRFQQNPRWIGHLQNGNAAFVYMVRPASDLKPGDKLHFSGDCLIGSRQNDSVQVQGDTTVSISQYHWADENADYSITDNEILDAYEHFSSPEHNQVDFTEVERLWLAGKYRWDEQASAFVAEQNSVN